MRSRSSCILLFLFVICSMALADLPSCYRARCTHCRIQFIAQMCSQTCMNCPTTQTFNKPTNNAGATNPVAHGKQTAVVYRTAERIQTLSQQDGQPQSAFTQQQQAQLPPQQPGSYQAPTPQQQQVAQALPALNSYPQAQYQTAQSTLPLNYYPQAQYAQQPTYFNNQYGQGQQAQFAQPFVFSTAPTVAAAQYAGYQGSQSVPQFGSYAQSAPSAQQPSSAAFNPFQPFLQQSFQAQQPQQPPATYNPFTFPALPPAATFAPFTPAPVTLLTMGTFPTFPPFPTHAPLTQAPQPPVTQAPVPLTHSNAYQQPYTGTAQVANGYVQSGQSKVVEPPRPRQVYNTQQQKATGQQQQHFVNPQQSQQSGYLQPARSNAIPTLQVGGQQQPARSIDSTPLQLEKQAYIGKEAPPAFVDTCPKQPNWEPCISKELANERFRNCCQRLGEGCSQLCNYDQSLTTIQLAVLTGRCPIAKVADMMICASGYEDATPCCQAYNVFEPGFEHCRPYCNPAAGLPNDGMLSEKYKCLGKLSQIQRCFYVSQRP